ncbi:apoptosis regulator BAX isoform X3 [Lampetra fluviatilis]
MDLGTCVKFILDRAERETETVGPAPTLEELGGSPAEQEDKGVIEVANCLRLIGDELDRDQKLQEMIRNMPIESPRELFMRVAIQIFADGTFNWGRVVALFYFAYRLVMKAYSRQLLDIVKTIISWAVDFIRENVIQWIREQGGWEGVRTYFGTQTWHSLTMFAAGALVSALVLWRIR